MNKSQINCIKEYRINSVLSFFFKCNTFDQAIVTCVKLSIFRETIYKNDKIYIEQQESNLQTLHRHSFHKVSHHYTL